MNIFLETLQWGLIGFLVVQNYGQYKLITVLTGNLIKAFEAINLLTGNQEQMDDVLEAIKYEHATKH